MNKKDLLSALFFLALGLFLVLESYRLSIWSESGPGPGFFPLFAAVIIIGSSIAIIVRCSLRHFKQKKEIVSAQRKEELSWFKLCSYVVLIMAYGLLLEKVGFLIMSTLFVITTLKCVERQSWKMTLCTGFVSIVGGYVVFVHFLGVLLPKGLLKW